MHFADARLVIIKLGTNTIMDGQGVRKAFLTNVVSEVAALIGQKKSVIIVTSGAIGLGRRRINYDAEQKDVPPQQGLAAVGQVALMNEYVTRFDSVGIACAQVLLSQHDLLNPQCLTNIKNTFDFLFGHGVVPIVNENDVVATEELRTNGVFSDNDALAALLAKQLRAGLLVMLTTKNGLLDAGGNVLPKVDDVSTVIKLGDASNDGRGGIDTKIAAIKTATDAGCPVFVSGSEGFLGFATGKAKGTLVPAK